MNKNKSGFTIVELLIVIVVIGILAAIMIVAYNGIQSKAKNAQILSAVDAYEKGIRMYMAEHNGQVPPSSMPSGYNTWDCAGKGYAQTSDFPVGECHVQQGVITAKVNPDLDTALQSYMSQLPTVSSSTSLIMYSSPGVAAMKSRGVLYLGGGTEANLIYYVPGDQVCGRGTKSSGDIGGGMFVTSCQVIIKST